MHHIKGQQRNQFQIFCLEQEVAKDSFVRLIDLFVDAITRLLLPTPTTGRASLYTLK